MGYADKLGFPFAALIGEDEIAQGKLSLKNMKTGEQQLLTPDEAVLAVLKTLAETFGAKPVKG